MRKVYFIGPGNAWERIRNFKEEILYRANSLNLGTVECSCDWTEQFHRQQIGQPIMSPREIAEADLKGIENADIIFAFIYRDIPSCGSHFEIAHALSKGKRVWAFHMDSDTMEEVQKSIERYVFLSLALVSNIPCGGWNMYQLVREVSTALIRGDYDPR